MLTGSAAASYAAEGIRFNALAPALVETPMSRRPQEDPEIISYTRRRQPQDADTTAVYFLSDQSSFVTGQVLSIDGAWELSDGQ